MIFAAIRWHLIDHRNIQIAEDRHGQRPWNRRRRHDEDVGRWLARGKSCPLRDPKLVLLINDREPEIFERNAVVKQRVRSHDDVRGIALRWGSQAASLLFTAACREDRRRVP